MNKIKVSQKNKKYIAKLLVRFRFFKIEVGNKI